MTAAELAARAHERLRQQRARSQFWQERPTLLCAGDVRFVEALLETLDEMVKDDPEWEALDEHLLGYAGEVGERRARWAERIRRLREIAARRAMDP